MKLFPRFHFSRAGLRSAFSIPNFVKTPFLLCLLISSSSMLAVLVAVFTVQPLVPLFYSLAQPSQQLAAKEWLFLFPALAFSITFIHVLCINVFSQYDRLITVLFAWTTVGVQIVLGLGLARILFIIA